MLPLDRAKMAATLPGAGGEGLVSVMGRPKSGALGSFPVEVRGAIAEMRAAHPGWGPQTLRTTLEQDGRFAGERLPSRARIAAWLKEQGKSRQYERRSELPQPAAEEHPEEPHAEWEMDAQGVVEVPGLGKVSLIHIGDVYSGLKVESLPCVDTSHPNTQDYQTILRRAFLKVGLPKRISLDHDSVFYDNASRSPFPSRLHLWLIALGVEVRFIHKPPPMEHSRIERTHQTLFDQAVRGQDFSKTGVAGLQQLLWERLDFLNRRYPSRALAGKPPLLAFPEAVHSQRPYRLEWEAEMPDMERVYAYLAQGRWFRKTTAQGQLNLGGKRYTVGQKFASQTLEITFDPEEREFVCTSEDGKQRTRLAPKGLSKEALMGELAPLMALPHYQLSLPLSRSAWRESLLASQFSGATF